MLTDFINLHRKQLRKIAIWLGIAVILFLVGRFIYDFASSGTVTITTGSNTASITISSIAPPPSAYQEQQTTSTVTKQGTGSLTVRLHAGTYTVLVQNGPSQISQSVTVAWRSHQHITLSPSGMTATEPVLFDSAQDIAVDGTRMIYLDGNTNSIVYLNSQNKAATIASNQEFSSVAWADAEYGIAQDTSGNLYVIDGNTIHPLQLSLSNLGNTSATTFAVAPDKTIYVAFGSNVYRGTESNGFQKIYSSFSPSDSLVAADGKVAIINPNTGGSKGSGAATIITTDGKETSKNFGHPLSAWTPWSQNGKYIVITIDSEAELFDASLNLVKIIPQTSIVNGGAWLGDSTLFYSSNGKLWSYTIAKNESALIAVMPDNRVIQGISVSADGSYIYATTSNSNDPNPTAVYRVGLKGQTVASYMSVLEDTLPINTPSYSIGVRNFSGTPVIEVTAFPGTDPTSALQLAQAAVQGIVGTNNVNYDVESGD